MTELRDRSPTPMRAERDHFADRLRDGAGGDEAPARAAPASQISCLPPCSRRRTGACARASRNRRRSCPLWWCSSAGARRSRRRAPQRRGLVPQLVKRSESGRTPTKGRYNDFDFSAIAAASALAFLVIDIFKPALIAFAVVLSDGGLERLGSSRSGGRKRKPDRETRQFFDSPLVKIRRRPTLWR